MSLFLLISVFAATRILGLICSKLCSNTLTKRDPCAYAIYIFVVSVVSCISYACFTGFTFQFDKASLLLSVALALASFLSLILSLFIYRLASVSGVNVITTSLSLVCSAIIGFTIFSEEIDTIKIIRTLIMLSAGVFVYLDTSEKDEAKQKQKSTTSNKGMLLIIIIILLLLNCYTTIQSKVIATTDLITDVNTFFFMTNVYMLAGSGLYLIYVYAKNKDILKQNLVLLKPKELFTMTGNTIASNLGVVLNVFILAKMELSVFTMISSALGILCAAFVSVLFREKLRLYSKISILLALLVTII